MAPRGDFPSSKQDQYMVRFPDGMREKLKARASENNRSLNAEIVARLERTFAHDARVHRDAVFEKALSGDHPEGVPFGTAGSAPDERESDVVVAGPWKQEVTLPPEIMAQLEDLKRVLDSQHEIIVQQTDLIKSLASKK